jgi:ABC-type multidrug transport system fused ATPase/permease subunit
VRSELIVVVIAHRVSTVRACDRIAVMDAGRIRAIATPTELERGNEYFQQVLALSLR